jgi:hypothetical protein
MTDPRLVIVVSNPFRSRVRPGLDTIDLGPVRLLIHKRGEKEWGVEDGLRAQILAVLSAKREHSVRIAAHLSGCFKEYEQSVFQVRLHEPEKEMKELSGVDDLEIWGFRHEIMHSPIWQVMSKILTALEGSKLHGEVAEELGGELNKAFVDALARDKYEEITLFRHQILGLFVSSRLSLEVVAERGPEAGESSLQRVRAALPAKTNQALHILEDGLMRLKDLHRAAPHQLDLSRKPVVDVLNDPPDLDAAATASENFNQWLSRLDGCLEKLRSALSDARIQKENPDRR